MRSLLRGLQKETYVLDIDCDSSVDLDQNIHWRLRDDCSIEIDVPKGQALNEIFSELKQKGIDVISMRNKSNRLEQLFLDLVDTNANDTPVE
jgi:ABC-2 type transport system ATP-binding protein